MTTRRSDSLIVKVLPAIIIVDIFLSSTGIYFLNREYKKTLNHQHALVSEMLAGEIKAAEKLSTDSLDSKGDVLTEFIAGTVVDKYFSFDFVGLDKIATELTRDPEIVNVQFFDTSGRALTDRVDSEDNVVTKRFDVTSKDQTLGYLLIEMSKKRVLNFLAESRERFDNEADAISSQLKEYHDKFARIMFTVILLQFSFLITVFLLGKERYVKAINDINDLTRIKENLEYSYNYIEKLFASLLEMIIVFDGNGKVERINRRTTEILGYKEADMASMRIEDLLALDGRALDIFSLMESKHEIRELEAKIKSQTGESIPVLLNGIVVKGDGEEKIIFILSAKDQRESRLLRELRSAQSALIENSKMAALGEMAGGVAHEINNPLGTIMIRAHQGQKLLTRDNPDKDRLRDFFEIIESTGDRIKHIIEGLRFFARSGEQDPFIPEKIKTIVKDTLLLCKEKFSHSGIKMNVPEIDEDLVVECRSVQIGQVLLNLLSNAFYEVQKVADENKWIQIEIKEDEDTIRMAVVDGGNGVAEEIREKILQPFFTTKEIGVGTGMGLSISKGIAEEHNGTLLLEEDQEHTTFVLTLPKKQNQAIRKIA